MKKDSDSITDIQLNCRIGISEILGIHHKQIGLISTAHIEPLGLVAEIPVENIITDFMCIESCTWCKIIYSLKLKDPLQQVSNILHCILAVFILWDQ